MHPSLTSSWTLPVSPLTAPDLPRLRCILDRPFAIRELLERGWPRDRISVVRELVDVMYTPKDSPYVSHAEGLALHTAYLEKFWATSVSMYDVLGPTYAGWVGGGCTAPGA